MDTIEELARSFAVGDPDRLISICIPSIVSYESGGSPHTKQTQVTIAAWELHRNEAYTILSRKGTP